MSELRADDPRRLGDYRLTRRLGQGGQGVVFLGHSASGAQVAVKLLHASLSKDPVVRRRFLGEAEAVRRVAAFCTAQLLDADLDGDRPYLVSEYVEGPSLGEHVVEKGPRRGGSLDRLAIGTATALGAIHRAGVVHRDLKPGNVLLSLDGPRVIDFGVSRLMDAAATTTRSPIGTPAYLSPERINGEAAGPPADMWAWGLTVAYTAGGRHAYMADTYQEILARILYGRPDLRGLSGRLREIVEACLAHDPRDRPDAEAVLRALLGQDAVTGDPLPSGALAATTPSRPPTTEPLDTPTVTYERAPGTAPAATPGKTPGKAYVETPGKAPATTPATTPAVGGGRRVKAWQVVIAVAGIAMGVAGFVFWLRGAQGPGLDGTWTGFAEHPSAQRVFPVELRLRPGGSTMRWGADLHCSGRLTPTRSAVVYVLDQVQGKACYPSTVRIVPSDDPNQILVKVTRSGADTVSYTGKVSRTS
ncbi:serine/threonine protein kinase [Nonomuraea sp. WAC 01424]|uniref:serine/threonine-protein kinase n=1 Tax=Nonomuraea sp. WAC 01424 TaxID=2203200 RepID=UPI000F78D450|nr:serine/threonine-protein kinase [Nonomuraea sp. WAC 01424]RSM96621.1 serine/threonine protein kinase [Nonomuraea sp. WAC 01424]